MCLTPGAKDCPEYMLTVECSDKNDEERLVDDER
jgi:hypothetical protein